MHERDEAVSDDSDGAFDVFAAHQLTSEANCRTFSFCLSRFGQFSD
jgi:hypothetical protein